MLRYFTAGESHGEALVAFLSGMPAGLKIDQAFLDRELWRRQQGYGRGGRMKIERDTAISSPASAMALPSDPRFRIKLRTSDWKNWEESLPVGNGDPAKHKRVASPRPGHADLAGALKYNSLKPVTFSSAPPRANPPLASPSAPSPKLYLRELGIEVLSHVITTGAVTLHDEVAWEKIVALHTATKFCSTVPIPIPNSA